MIGGNEMASTYEDDGENVSQNGGE